MPLTGRTICVFMAILALTTTSAWATAPRIIETQYQAAHGAFTVISVANPHLYLAKADGADAAVAAIMRRDDRLVINGPLFDGDGNPVGGYVTRKTLMDQVPQAEAGQTVKKPVIVKHGDGNFAWRNQIFGQRLNGSFFMIPSGAAAMPQPVNFAIQNGPALVVGGKNLHDPNSTHVASRIGIGFTADNRLIVADTQDAVTMYDLAEALRQAGAQQAIYLDGNRNGYIESMNEYGRLPRGAYLLHIY